MISFTTLLSYGSYLVVILLLIDKYFNGAGKIKNQVIETYKERNTQLEASLKNLQDQINQQGKDIAKLTGILEEKDKIILSLNQTIQNRNPALEETLAAIKNFLETIYKQGTVLALKTEEQTVMIKAQGQRDNS